MKLTLVDHSWKTVENEVLTRDVFEIGSYTVKRICTSTRKTN